MFIYTLFRNVIHTNLYFKSVINGLVFADQWVIHVSMFRKVKK